VESKHKIIIITITTIIIMGHVCKRGAVWGNQQEREKGRERVLKGDHDRSMLCFYI
jgi:hypothetical protein